MSSVLLVQPRLEMHSSPPLGIGYIASMLQESSIKVDIFDFNQKEHLTRPFTSLGNLIRKEKPEVVGVSSLSSYHMQAMSIARFVKNLSGSTKVVMGGVHPSALPRNVLHDEHVDFVVIGEGEMTMLELCNSIEKNRYNEIKGLGFKNEGHIMINERRELVEDLDCLPFPSWQLIEPSLYEPAPQGLFLKKSPAAPIMTSRGCAYSCTYCASSCFWGRRWRARSPLNVVSEAKLLVDDFGVKEIDFIDDNFTFDKSRALQICKELMSERVDVPWTCSNGLKIERVDREILHAMKRAGCYQIVFGIESLSSRVLKRVGRTTTARMVKDAVKTAREEGMIVGGFFIIGLPSETKVSALETVQLSLELGLDWAQYHIFTPLPGSVEFSRWVEKNRIDVSSLDFSSFNILRGNSGGYETELTLKDSRKLRNSALLRFYTRPKVLTKMLSRLKLSQSPWLVKRLVATLKTW